MELRWVLLWWLASLALARRDWAPGNVGRRLLARHLLGGPPRRIEPMAKPLVMQDSLVHLPSARRASSWWKAVQNQPVHAQVSDHALALYDQEQRLVERNRSRFMEKIQLLYPDVSQDDVAAIGAYTSKHFWHLNYVARERDVSALKDYEVFVQELLTALGKLPPYHGTTYRGVDVEYAEVSKWGFRKGARLALPAFTSTSKYWRRAWTFPEHRAKTIFKLQLRYGEARCIEDFSSVRNEHEVLLPPGVIVFVSDVYEEDGITWVILDEQPSKEELVAALPQARARSPQQAAANGLLSELEAMLAQDRSLVNAPGRDGRTAVHCAAEADQVEVLKLLLRFGASATQRDKARLTALDLAIAGGAVRSVELLLETFPSAPTGVDTLSDAPLLMWAMTAVGGARDEQMGRLLVAHGEPTAAAAPARLAAMEALAAREARAEPLLDRASLERCLFSSEHDLIYGGI